MKRYIKYRSPAELLLRSDGAISLLAILTGFLAANLAILCVGRNPVNFYRSLLQVISGFYTDRAGSWHWEIRNPGEWLNFSVIFILCGFSFGFTARAGLFNIGGEGQYIAGLTAAQTVALVFPGAPLVRVIAAVFAAVMAGALWGSVAGFLKAMFKVSEVVATIMLNYIALYLSVIVTRSIRGATTYKTPNYPDGVTLHLGWLDSFAHNSMNAGIFLVVLAALFFWLIMEKTKTGYGLRATGFNIDAAFCSGIPVRKNITFAFTVSGAFAGLAGGIMALGSFNFGRILGGMDNYGFYGIAVGLAGNCKVPGTVLTGLLFGVLRAAQPSMQAKQIPHEIIFIIQGIIVVFISLREGLRMMIRGRAKI